MLLPLEIKWYFRTCRSAYTFLQSTYKCKSEIPTITESSSAIFALSVRKYSFSSFKLASYPVTEKITNLSVVLCNMFEIVEKCFIFFLGTAL